MTANSTSTSNANNSGNQQQQQQQHCHYNLANAMTSAPSIRFEPSLIEYKFLRFLITDKPTDALLNQYIQELKRRNVTDVVRVCESTYSSERLENAGIKCHNWVFDDGTPPPPQIIEQWLHLIIERFKEYADISQINRKSSSSTAQQQSNGSNNRSSSDNNEQTLPCIAVHCVAGLGRAPVLVAIALIESGLKYEDAVERIRARRRGAINQKQLDYLSAYKPKKVLMFKKQNKCCIM